MEAFKHKRISLLAIPPMATVVFLFIFKTQISATASQPEVAPQNQVTGVAPYLPESVWMGNDETVYLFDKEGARIHRWSVPNRNYLAPITLDESPNYMVYASSLNKIYIGYHQVVTQIELDLGITETHFITSSREIRGMAPLDEHLLLNLTDFTSVSMWRIYDSSGVKTQQLASPYSFCVYSKDHTWSDISRKVYLLKDGIHPIDIVWVEISEEGTFVDAHGSPYHGDFDMEYPIRITADGELAFLGPGRVLDALTLASIKLLSIENIDAQWYESTLYTIYEDSGNTIVQEWDDEYLPGNSTMVEGSPLRIFNLEEGFLVLTDLEGEPQFWILNHDLEIIYHFPAIYAVFFPALIKAPPYPIYIPPGTYTVNKCRQAPLYNEGQSVGTLKECIPEVEVWETGYMQFNITWTADLIDGIDTIIKWTDAEDHNIYLMDNLDNRYDHVQVGGSAGQTTLLYDGVPAEGWFLFLPAKENAARFTFYDDDQGIAIPFIRLIP